MSDVNQAWEAGQGIKEALHDLQKLRCSWQDRLCQYMNVAINATQCLFYNYSWLCVSQFCKYRTNALTIPREQMWSVGNSPVNIIWKYSCGLAVCKQDWYRRKLWWVRVKAMLRIVMWWGGVTITKNAKSQTNSVEVLPSFSTPVNVLIYERCQINLN